MGCVAEDASLVKWLLDIGSDIHRCRNSQMKELKSMTLYQEMMNNTHNEQLLADDEYMHCESIHYYYQTLVNTILKDRI